MIQAFVLDGLVLLIEVKIVESTHLCNHEVMTVVTTVAGMVRNLFMSFISKLVGNITCGRCGVIQDVCIDSRMQERGWQRNNNCRSARRGYW